MDEPADAIHQAKLRLMASILDIPLESFFSGTEVAERIIETSECLRLWDKIATADDRRRALAHLRELANEPIT